MANEQQVKILTEKGVTGWNEWRAKEPGLLPDLSMAHLSQAKLGGAIFKEANLSGAILSEVDFSGADLSGAVLSGAVLSGAVLIRADLRGTVLNAADLRVAMLSGAEVRRRTSRGQTSPGPTLAIQRWVGPHWG